MIPSSFNCLIEEISNQYNFNQAQREQLNELMNEKYASNWSSLIYGTGNSDIVNVAISQIGNVGGEPYWSWYGFESRVEWCACFVSWCANECRLYRYWYNSKICRLSE